MGSTEEYNEEESQPEQSGARYIREHYQIKQTIVTILAKEQRHIEAAKQAILHHRAGLESYISRNPVFAISLEPVPINSPAPEVVERMAEASERVDVGPMAAVAGTLATLALEAMLDAGASFGVVDNGGDIAMYTDEGDENLLIGIYAPGLEDVAFELPPTNGIMGICTSSATVGHSISFGEADAATVISQDVSLADACATRLGNSVGDTLEEGVFECLSGIKDLIDGALVVKDGKLAMFGSLPQIVRVKVPPHLITRGQDSMVYDRGGYYGRGGHYG